MELQEVKQALYKKQLVEYDERQYIVTAYILRYDEKNKDFKHLLELTDLKARHSVCIAEIRKVKIISKEDDNL